LHDFTAVDPASGTNADGAFPCASLIASSNVLYGTASAGGTGAAGTVFGLDPSAPRFQTIHNFATLDAAGTNIDGAFPVSPVLRVGNSLYGTTSGGGPGGVGTIFSFPVPPPPAVITNITRNPNGGLNLSFLGSPGSTNVVQVTDSLVPPIAWFNVSTNVADANGVWQLVENSATGAIRFYRSYAK
jgi:uncharacterized repeat protein (TIGR03803 family)